ncbi:MAG TPA: sulfur carrier protein ThiS, partial [Thermoanaerobaculia bacterium]|nr:sulfur carrier protein ThiS [Thermoanaerobaculia bacterium]
HPRTVAVELNGDILPRDEYGARPLRAGDRLEVVHFVQGGRN